MHFGKKKSLSLDIDIANMINCPLKHLCCEAVMKDTMEVS
jgi:hypothetical protein